MQRPHGLRQSKNSPFSTIAPSTFAARTRKNNLPPSRHRLFSLHNLSKTDKTSPHPHRISNVRNYALFTDASIAMAYNWLRQRSSHRNTNHPRKPALPPSTLSSLLHTTLSTIPPLFFFTTFVIAGTIVLSYSLSLNEPVPARFVVGVSAAFAALVGLSVWVFVWSKVRGVRIARKKNNRGEDIERSGTARERRVHLFPTVSEHGPEQPQPQPFQYQQQRQQHAFMPTPPFSHHPSYNNANIIAHPDQTYRGLPQTFHQPPPPPRRGSFELNAILERSNESDRRPSPPFTAHPAHHHQPVPPGVRGPIPVSQHARRPPVPYRSPSVASLPESLRAPGRGAETPKTTVEIRGQRQAYGRGMYRGIGTGPAVGLGLMASPALASGPMQLPMPRVPEPLRFGASITGRGDGEGFEGGGGRGDERRRLMKARGRGMG